MPLSATTGDEDARDGRLSAQLLSALHAEPDPVHGGRIVDASGRQVLLRGVNVNAAVDYWRGTGFATTFPFTAADADRMAAIGWSSVRLLLSWSKVEPRPGHYDEAYLGRIAADVRVLARRRIYSIVDFHQDAWGATLAARPGEVCPLGSPAALGWDGAPGWATLDGNASRCATAGIRELSPAVLDAFKAFWADAPGPGGVGIRTRYERMVGHVAARFAHSSSVAGYDVMNEPNAFGPAQQTALADLYAGSLRAVRRAERRVGGTRHLLFFEPSALWSSTGSGPPPNFPHDRDVVYAPHIYTGGFTGGPITADAFQVALDEARAFGGAPVLSGEWGADPNRAAPGGDLYFLDHQQLQDDFRIGATLWTWRESCGDPHKVADHRAGRVPTVWGEFDVDCRTNSVLGVRHPVVAELTRAYPRAAPGRLDHTSYDPVAKRLVATGSGARRGVVLEVFFPSVSSRLAIRMRGLCHVRLRRAPGGATLVTARATGGAWSVRLAERVSR
ncbi:MAG: glycoside hydrolase family 5 protein [Actinomycetota bacterium]|nr:glycoside hydrolase family 5 protein [Actinomycetota bacterium]